MDIIVMPTAAEAELLTARIIADAINAKPFSSWGSPPGAPWRTCTPIW